MCHPYPARLNGRCPLVTSWHDRATRLSSGSRGPVSFRYLYLLWFSGCCFHVCLSHSSNKCFLKWASITLQHCNFAAVSPGLLKDHAQAGWNWIVRALLMTRFMGGLCASQIAFPIWGLSNCPHVWSGTLSMADEKIDPGFILQVRLTAVLCTGGTYRINKVYFIGSSLWSQSWLLACL